MPSGVRHSKRRPGRAAVFRASLRGKSLRAVAVGLITLACLSLCVAQAIQAPAGRDAGAPKAVLFQEDLSDPAGKRFDGFAHWSIEPSSDGGERSRQIAVRADIEIPAQKMAVHIWLRRSDDKMPNASHIIEIKFELPPDFPYGGVVGIPGLLMKPGASERGVPLSGTSAKVAPNSFRIGLSSVDFDIQRNLPLLKEREWLDIPIVYDSGKRAILAVEKGAAGQAAFSAAFAAWQQ